MQWKILLNGAIEIHVQTIVDSTIDDLSNRDIFGNIKYSNKDLIKERLINIKKKIPILLEKENYEELARLKKIYEELLKKYKDEQD